MKWEKLDELTDLALAEALAPCSSESMSTSMGSLVGGVSLTLPSMSDDREAPVNWEHTGLDDTDLDAGVAADADAPVGFVDLGPGLPKKFMRLFCFIFSDDDRFSGTFCDGMLDVGRDGEHTWTRDAAMMGRVVVVYCGMFVQAKYGTCARINNLRVKLMFFDNTTVKRSRLLPFVFSHSPTLVCPTFLYARAPCPPPPRVSAAHRTRCSGRNLVFFFILITSVD